MEAARIAQRLRDEGLETLLDQARSLLERSGQPLADLMAEPAALRGVIHLDLTPAQARALAGFWGPRRTARKLRGDHIAIRLADLNARCTQHGADLFAVLTAGGVTLQTKADEETSLRDEFTQAHRRLAVALAGQPAAQAWIGGLAADTASGRYFRRLWNEDRQAAQTAAHRVARAVGELPAPGDTHLALFAARLTGDPHAFDQGTPAGQLLILAIGELCGEAAGCEEFPPSVWRALQLAQANLEVDAVSSDVVAANFHNSGHPVLQAMAAYGGGWKLPLRVVRELQLPRVDSHPAYVLENPSVFETLAARTREWPSLERPLLICTAGFLSAAGYRLLEQLAAANYRLYYGGDFDWNGLSIALALQKRFPALVFWGMGVEDYRTALALKTAAGDLPAQTVLRLERVAGELASTARAMIEARKPAYQEQVADRLWADLVAERAGEGQA